MPSLAAEYDDIAADYAASKQLPYRIVVEAPTLFALAGDVRGKTVLDLPRGDGTYARAFARRGAASVLGVDLSSGMVERARMNESEAPLGQEPGFWQASLSDCPLTGLSAKRPD